MDTKLQISAIINITRLSGEVTSVDLISSGNAPRQIMLFFKATPSPRKRAHTGSPHCFFYGGPILPIFIAGFLNTSTTNGCASGFFLLRILFFAPGPFFTGL